jgi:hypothetical protein
VLEHCEALRTSGRLDRDRRTNLKVRVDTKKIGILEEIQYLRTETSEIASHHEGRAHHTPKCEVSLVFGIAAETGMTNVTNTVHSADKHVNVIEASGRAVLKLVKLALGDSTNGRESLTDVTGRTIEMSTCGANPLFRIVVTPVTSREYDITAGSLESHTHSVVVKLRILVFGEGTVVVLQVVNAEFSECLSVNELTLEATGITGTGKSTCTGIHTEFKPLGMDVVSNCTHTVGEFLGVSNDSVIFISLLERPAVIYNYVFVSDVLETELNDFVGHIADHLFVDILTEGVPRVPAHGWFVNVHNFFLSTRIELYAKFRLQQNFSP